MIGENKKIEPSLVVKPVEKISDENLKFIIINY